MTIQSIKDSPLRVASDNIRFLQVKYDICGSGQTFRRAPITDSSESSREDAVHSVRYTVESFWADAKGRLVDLEEPYTDSLGRDKAQICARFYFSSDKPRIEVVQRAFCFPGLEGSKFDKALRRVQFVVQIMQLYLKSQYECNLSMDKV